MGPQEQPQEAQMGCGEVLRGGCPLGEVPGQDGSGRGRQESDLWGSQHGIQVHCQWLLREANACAAWAPGTPGQIPL